MGVKGRNALITGDARGVGKVMALAFANAGVDIILNGRGEIPEEKIEEIEAFGIKCVRVSGDISNYEKVGQMVKEAEEKLGSIYILVNNAGITNGKLVMQTDTEDFEECLDTNLIGTFNMMQYVLKKMMKQREGAITNLSSVSELIGNIGQTDYVASKTGIVGLTKSAARKAVTRGITCSAVAPRSITTDITEVLADRVKEQAEKQIPMQRSRQVKDVAQATVFLVQSPYIAGQVINVDDELVMHG